MIEGALEFSGIIESVVGILSGNDTKEVSKAQAQILCDKVNADWKSQHDPDAEPNDFYLEQDTDGNWQVVTDEPGAAMIEYGTSRIAPQPFIRPAIDAAEPEMTDAAVELITDVIEAAIL
jgi:hypothetical protein